MKVSNLIEYLQKYYKPDDIVAHHMFTTEDVEEIGKNMGYVFTQNQIDYILENVEHHIDSEYGMSYDSIESAIEDYVDGHEQEVTTCDPISEDDEDE